MKYTTSDKEKKSKELTEPLINEGRPGTPESPAAKVTRFTILNIVSYSDRSIII